MAKNDERNWTFVKRCRCNNLHFIEFSVWGNSGTFVSMNIQADNSFFRRFVKGIKFIFGGDRCQEEMVLYKRDLQELQGFLEEFVPKIQLDYES